MGFMAKKLSILLLMLGLAGIAWPQSQPATTEPGAKSDAQEAGRSTKNAAKKTGHKAKKGTKKATHKAAKKTRQGAGKVEDKTAPPR